MENSVSKSDLLDWIDLLYTDLSKDNLLIGGYYFTFEDLPDFIILKTELNKYQDKIRNKIKKLENSGIDKQDKRLKELYEDLNFVKIELLCKNKVGKKCIVPCTPEEFDVVFGTLLDFKKDVECFKDYCIEEAEKIEKDDIPSYMIFLNDILQDIRDRFHGTIQEKEPYNL